MSTIYGLFSFSFKQEGVDLATANSLMQRAEQKKSTQLNLAELRICMPLPRNRIKLETFFEFSGVFFSSFRGSRISPLQSDTCTEYVSPILEFSSYIDSESPKNATWLNHL